MGRFWVGFGTVLGRSWSRFGVVLGGLGAFFLWSWAFLRCLRVSWWVFVGSWRRLLIFGPLLIPAFVLLHVACWVPAACLRNSRQCNALPVPMLSQVYLGGLGSLLVGLGAPSGRSWAVLGRSWNKMQKSSKNLCQTCPIFWAPT